MQPREDPLMGDELEAARPASTPSWEALAATRETMTDHERQQFHIAEYDRDRPLCDAKVPSFHDDETLFDCGHHAEVEALWLDGRWHPRCQQHVNDYPANRVRPLGGNS